MRPLPVLCISFLFLAGLNNPRAISQHVQWELLPSVGMFMMELYTPIGVSVCPDISVPGGFGVRTRIGLGGMIFYVIDDVDIIPMTISAQVDIRTGKDSVHKIYGFTGLSFLKTVWPSASESISGHKYFGNRWENNLYLAVGIGYRPRQTSYEWTILFPLKSNIYSGPWYSPDYVRRESIYYIIIQFAVGFIL